MAHQQQQDFCNAVKQRFPEYFRDSFVLDVGSYDVNGNNRYLFQNCGYIGVDIAPGKNVDICCAGHELGLPAATFDTIVSTECAEHDRHFALTLANMVRMLKPGGLFLFTCATTGRPEHGTRRTTPSDAPPLMGAGEWADYYRNITQEDFRGAIDVDDVFGVFAFSGNEETKDLYFWGLKKGERRFRQDYSFLLPSSAPVEIAEPIPQELTSSAVSDLEAKFDELRLGLNATEKSVEMQNRALLAQGIQASAVKGLAHELSLRVQEVEREQNTWLKRTVGYVSEKFGVARRAPAKGVMLGLHLHPKVCILTPMHTTYVARLIVNSLAMVGVQSYIIHEKPMQGFADVPHFVIAPQIFGELPNFYVAFQMEQSISQRWFNKAYFDILERSFAIFDYSVDNIGYLTSNGLHAKQIYYMPLGCIADYNRAEGEDLRYTTDVLFYGDVNCPRRRAILSEVQKHFKVDVVSEVYGEVLYRRIAGAKVVLNLHYYENALLETTRLHECLSLGKSIVSEKGSDQLRHGNLEGVVEFVDTGDVQGLIAAIARLVEDEEYRHSREHAVKSFANAPQNPFIFHFMRFLLGVGEINFEQFYAIAGSYFEFRSERICLGLPEYRKRQEAFDASNRFGFEMFPGLRHSLGWIGCGLSYKFIMRKAKEQGFERITVCEDDVEFRPGWEGRFAEIIDYLDGADDWDIFAGLIADLHPSTKVSKVLTCGGGKLAYVSKMVSMVLNVYSHRAFDALADWDPEYRDNATNTIDRYIEHGRLRFVTADPFLVGHAEELDSTLWSFQNTQYNPLIEKSAASLHCLISHFEEERAEYAHLHGVVPSGVGAAREKIDAG